MGNDRHKQILQILDQKGEILLNEMKDYFDDISVMTLRRDLIALEKEGYLIRTHGGAVSTKKTGRTSGEEDEYSRRAAERTEAKFRIGEKALSLLETNRSIYFDAGSTVMCLAKQLPDNAFSIITSGANTALQLMKKSNISVVLLGGQMNKNTLSTSGPQAEAFIKSINIDLAFMSASGYSPDSGFTVSNIHESEVKRMVVERAKKVVMLLDSEKINSTMTFTFCTLKDIDIWICDRDLPADVARDAQNNGVSVI